MPLLQNRCRPRAQARRWAPQWASRAITLALIGFCTVLAALQVPWAGGAEGQEPNIGAESHTPKKARESGFPGLLSLVICPGRKKPRGGAGQRGPRGGSMTSRGWPIPAALSPEGEAKKEVPSLEHLFTMAQNWRSGLPETPM